jgi:hypothetical protein
LAIARRPFTGQGQHGHQQTRTRVLPVGIRPRPREAIKKHLDRGAPKKMSHLGENGAENNPNTNVFDKVDNTTVEVGAECEKGRKNKSRAGERNQATKRTM